MSTSANITFDRQRSSNGSLLLVMTAVFFGSILAIATQAQTITNATFESGRSGWGDRAMVLPFSAFEGSDLDAVAVVDGGNVVHKLRQTITGLRTGSTYELAFDAARWTPDTVTAPVTASIYVNGSLYSTVERDDNAGMTPERVRFTAPAETVELRIEPGRTGNGAMLLDDIALQRVEAAPALEVDEQGNVALSSVAGSTGGRLALHVTDRAGNVVQVAEASEGPAMVLNIASLPNGQYQVCNANDGAVLGRFIKL